jgi:hypothetical protein
MTTPQVRAGQVITTFGPGSMVDFPDVSVVIAGLENWRYDAGRIPMVDESRLVAKLRRILNVPQLMLREPPPANEQTAGFHPDITGWRFPEWFIVQRTIAMPKGYRARRLVHWKALEKGRFKDEDNRWYPVVPVRFVRACPKGHLGDIEWREFVHGERGGCIRDLYLEERGTSGDLDEIWVRCDCGKDRVMSQAARRELRALGSCNGARPWLGRGTREACGDANRLLIRSASNAYFPQTMSVISIPDTAAAIDAIVDALWDDFLSDVETDADLAKVRAKPTPKIRLEGYGDAEVLTAIRRRRSGGVSEDRPVKEAEYDALSEAKEELGVDEPGGDFFARALPPDKWAAPWMSAIQRVVLVHRLREVVAQVGFTRFEAAGPDIQGELELDVKRAPLAIDLSWLPAVENRGEGIFLQFHAAAIRQWCARPAVMERARSLLAGFELWQKEHEGSPRRFPGLPYYLLHSLSHLLLTAIALECGYPASSLRERVYAGEDRYGILIYTGSSDAEGTLGGLVEAGRAISRHMRRALELGMLCSNDPVCAYHAPTPHDYQWLLGSACHGCLLIAETSCEQRNDFLDRSLVVPTVEGLGTELFPAIS